MSMTKEEYFFEVLSINRLFKLCRVKVLENSPAWIVSHEFSDMQILSLLFMERKGRPISFCEAYKMRWLERSRDGYLIDSKAIRTPLIEYLKSKNAYVQFSCGELTINSAFRSRQAWTVCRPRGR